MKLTKPIPLARDAALGGLRPSLSGRLAVVAAIAARKKEVPSKPKLSTNP
jgi:hypothetical protein